MAATDIFRLDGKHVLVTGASGGLGEHFAGVLADAGAHVILAARRTDALERVASALRAKGGHAQCVPLDVGSSASIDAAFAQMPLPDVVINNAGINVVGTALDLPEDDWARVMDINVKGAWLVARAAIARWIEHKRPGNLVNIASILGLRVQRDLAAYAASKAALVQLTRALSIDYARHGIRANALCPGYFATDINREWLASPGGERMLQRIPFRRPGELHELNGALLLLCSDASSYMSGSTVVVDGAHTQSSL
jgi:NAD(P)-dependent dehydrogenase (short-subunit alcohol dehydrogenase family)